MSIEYSTSKSIKYSTSTSFNIILVQVLNIVLVRLLVRANYTLNSIVSVSSVWFWPSI